MQGSQRDQEGAERSDIWFRSFQVEIKGNGTNDGGFRVIGFGQYAL